VLRSFGVNTRTPSTGSGDAVGRELRRSGQAGETVETLRIDWGIWKID
jgi:hypothetical protein